MENKLAISFACLTVLGQVAQAIDASSDATALSASGAAGVPQRFLQGGSPFEDGFEPLSCNAGLSSGKCSGSWTDMFGRSDEHSKRLTIPCGECVVMDLDRDELVLKDGIDIQGKLVFPDGYQLTMYAPLIAVQGELEMKSTKPVDGEPDVTFIMTGDSEQFFTPHAENKDMCKGDCNAGIKAIIVAGGKLDIQGLQSGIPSWLHLYDVSDSSTRPSGLILSEDIVDGWAPGAEVLITSYTSDWDRHQIRTIVDVAKPKDGKVLVELDEVIERPTTLLESEDFAVEVALLSRNILFQGESGADPLTGGHFIVMQTPRVKQSIDGIEIRNFGQQGVLGRYPLHFHFSGDVSGSVVSRNSIRQSNQRCVVVHGSDNLQVEDNVAFDFKGHCYILEDGIEVGNTFARNLGAYSQKANKRKGDVIFDGSPAIFWITNPSNWFVGNVAAGAYESGYWFDMDKRGPYADMFTEPIELPFYVFQDNVAHSAREHGITTYPRHGIHHATFKDVKVYRNKRFGASTHICHDVKIEGGIFADNGLSLDIDRSEGFLLDGVTFIGLSDVYRDQRKAQSSLPDVCDRRLVRGLELHPSGRYEHTDVIIRNTSFSNFDVGCRSNKAISVDQKNNNQFKVHTSFEGTTVEFGDFSLLDACPFVQRPALIYFVDQDGGLSPQSARTTRTSTIVANHEEMLHFTSPSRCTEVKENCYSYCEDTCFRTFDYWTSSEGTENFSARACARGDTNDCVFFEPDVVASDSVYEDRRFPVYLPQGDYDVSFVDAKGNDAWPLYVIEDERYDVCPGSSKYDIDVRLVVPSPSRRECDDVIKNGDLEESDDDPLYWYNGSGGIKLARKMGVGGSNAVMSTSSKPTARIAHILDKRCMEKGTRYRLSAYVKLVDNRDRAVKCTPDKRNKCPEIGYMADGETVEVAGWTSTGKVKDGFQLLEGTITVDGEIEDAKKVSIYIKSNQKGVTLTVDDVSMEEI